MKHAFFQLFPEKQKAVLTAALNEFGTHDFDDASLDRVVASAGISKGGLYEYISSKEELYLYCMVAKLECAISVYQTAGSAF